MEAKLPIYGKQKLGENSNFLKVDTVIRILSAGQTFANTDQTTFSSEELKAVVAKHFEQEVDRVAKSNQWGEYQLEYDLWVPGSANHLPKCDAKLVITGRDNQPLPVGNLKRSVSCEDLTAPWRINVTIKSSVTLPVVVAATTVGRNEVVTANHLKLETRTISRSTISTPILNTPSAWKPRVDSAPDKSSIQPT